MFHLKSVVQSRRKFFIKSSQNYLDSVRRFFFPSLISTSKIVVLLAFLTPKFLRTCAKNPQEILCPRKNARFSENFLVNKLLPLFFKFFVYQKLAHLTQFILLHFWLKRSLQSWPNSIFMTLLSKIYSQGFTSN